MPTLIQALRQALAAHADDLAVQGESWLLTYRDLERESARLTRALKAAGVGPRHRVPLVMRRSPQFVVALLAVVRCGAAYVPFDTAWPASRRDALLGRLDAPAGLIDSALRDSALPGGRRRWLDPLQADGAAHIDVSWPAADDERTLYVMFTSGSTGEPKGVVVPHRGVRRLVCNADYAEFRPDARWALMSSPAFDASTLEVWAPLLHGGTCVVQESEWPSLDQLAQFIVEREISDLWLTAALFNVLVDEHHTALGGLRQLLTGGERASPAHMRRFLEACPRVKLINGYGPTENTTFSLCRSVSREDTREPHGVPIGRPIAGTTALVLGEDGHPAANGEVGELWVAGDGIAQGYMDDPARTAERFVHHDGRLHYRTGDRVRQRPDGAFDFLGRADRQVKLRGHRIELDEIELALIEAPGVGDAVVWVEGERAEASRLVGAYSAAGEQRPAAEAVIRWLAERLPAPSVPQLLHPAAELPRNRSGKVDRAAVERQFGGLSGRRESGAPAQWNSTTERRLAELWQRHLHVEVDSPNSDFAGLGGSSLTAMRLAHDAVQAFGRELDPIDVLRHPRLADQARAIDAASPVSEPSSGAANDALRLTGVQRDVVIASRLDPSGSAYSVHLAWHLESAMAPGPLRGLFERLAQRHPLLRSTVVGQGMEIGVRVGHRVPGDWFSAYDAPMPLPAGRYDWAPALLEWMARPLEPARGLMRLGSWPCAAGGQLIVWSVHHAAIDDAGLTIAQRELAALAAGRRLPAVYGSPFAFASLERAWIDRRRVDDMARRAGAALSGQRAPLPPAPGVGLEQDIELADELGARVIQWAAARGVTPFMPLLAAWGLALQGRFGPAWRFVATPFSRRLELETLEPIGLLLDLRLVEAGAREAEPLAAHLSRVQAEMATSLDRSMEPVALVAEELARMPLVPQGALTQFAFTWRIDPLAGESWRSARPLPTPQIGARFGICLHAESVRGRLALRLEALRAAHQAGHVDNLAQRLLDALSRIVAVDEPLPARVEAPASPSAQPDAGALDLAMRHWSAVLGRAPSPGAHFLREGGNSLLAMKLLTGLRAEAGVEIDAAAFLQVPTLEQLALQLRAPRRPDSRHRTWIGPGDAARVVLVLPGYRGSALGMFRLADALYRRLPPGYAIATADLRSIVQHGPREEPLRHLNRQLEQLARDIGSHRLSAVLGFSMGGLLAVQLIDRLRLAAQAWLVDAYSFDAMDGRTLPRLARGLVSALRSPRSTWRMAWKRRQRVLANRTQEQDALTQDQVEKWRDLLQDLSCQRVATGGLQAILVRSQVDSHRMGLVRHASSNGWNPKAFAGLRVVSLPLEHEALRQEAAPTVAQALMEHCGGLPVVS